MHLDFTAEQDELRSSVRDVLGRESPTSVARAMAEGTAGPDALWRTMGGLGWPALALPETVGGLGLGMVELGVVVEELGRHLAVGPFLATVTQYAAVVTRTADDAQASALLGPVAEGTVTGALAIAESDDRWSPGEIAATAERDGSGWRVTGTKHVVCDAATADELAVVAKTTDGLGVFVVPRGETTVTPVRSVDPTRPWATVTIDATVGDDRALSPGSAGGGVRRGIAEAVAAVAVETVGLCDGILRIATDYAKAREQFGVPIGSFQAVKHKLADMYVALERARATTYAAVTALAEDAPEAEHMASLAKAAAGDAQELIGQDGIQLMGGIGYTWEHDMHLWVKRAKSAGAVFGTAREHRKLIAAELVR